MLSPWHDHPHRGDRTRHLLDGPVWGHGCDATRGKRGRGEVTASLLSLPSPVTGLIPLWSRGWSPENAKQDPSAWAGRRFIFLLSCFKQPLRATGVCEGVAKEGGVAMAKGDLQGMNSLLFLPRNEWVAKTSPHMKTCRC